MYICGDGREEKFEVCLSVFTLNELNACYEPKRSLLLERLGEISYEVLPQHQDLSRLANRIVEMGILTAKSIDDCKHIASAVLAECDCVISWNFKHMSTTSVLNKI